MELILLLFLRKQHSILINGTNMLEIIIGIIIFAILFPFAKDGHGTGLPWLDELYGYDKKERKRSKKERDKREAIMAKIREEQWNRAIDAVNASTEEYMRKLKMKQAQENSDKMKQAQENSDKM